MVATRSQTQQSRLEDFGSGSKSTAAEKKESASRKRKQDDQPASAPKRQKQKRRRLTESGGNVTTTTPTKPPSTSKSKPIMINRSPVLQLWAACVAQHLYPDLTWTTSLAVGSAISTLCAISKGRSIGVIEEADPDRKKEAKKRAEQAGADREVQVMGFKLSLKGGEVLRGKPKRGDEAPLKAKFDREEEGAYMRVKRVMDQAIETWQPDTKNGGELNRKAFHMYEQFRPTVQSGQGGWGRKGELDLDKIKEVVERE